MQLAMTTGDSIVQKGRRVSWQVKCNRMMSNIVSRDMSQIGALGDEFADEAIRVLVGTPLPGRVWIGKVKRETAQSLGNFTIQREFSTAVGGYAFHLVLWQSSEQSGHGIAGRFSGYIGELDGQGEPGFPVYQG